MGKFGCNADAGRLSAALYDLWRKQALWAFVLQASSRYRWARRQMGAHWELHETVQGCRVPAVWVQVWQCQLGQEIVWQPSEKITHVYRCEDWPQHP